MKKAGIAVGRLAEEEVAHILSGVIPSTGPDNPIADWTWRCTPTAIELWAPLTSALSSRESLVAAGGALVNLRILIRARGVLPDTRLLPDAKRPDLIAAVRPLNTGGASERDQALATAVQLYPAPPRAAGPASADALTSLRHVARSERAWMGLIPTGMQPLGQTVEGEFVVIGTVLDGATARLQAGQATHRVLHTATVDGVTAVVVAGALLTPDDRLKLRLQLGSGLWPQAVLRVG